MPVSLNPYSAPAMVEGGTSRSLARRFASRSVIALALGVLVAFTVLLISGLWAIDALDLGGVGVLFLLSLVVASVILVCASRAYAKGNRGFAVSLIISSLAAMLLGVMMALHHAGMLLAF